MTMSVDLTLDSSTCLPGGATISPQRAEQVALVAKALSDPVRLRIFHHIAASCCSSVCACHLPEVFGVTQPTRRQQRVEQRGRSGHIPKRRREHLEPMPAQFVGDDLDQLVDWSLRTFDPGD